MAHTILDGAETLNELQERRTASTPSQPVFHRIRYRHDDESLTFDGFARRVRGLAAALAEAVPIGARVLLVYPSSIDFVVAFCACTSAGRIPVPHSLGTGVGDQARLLAVARDCDARIVLTTADTKQRLRQAAPALSESLSFDSEQDLKRRYGCHGSENAGTIRTIRGEDTAFLQKGCPSECCSHYRLCSGEERARQGAASHLENGGGRLRQHSIYCAYSTQMDTPFLQYTSGSTGSPKGVVVTHRNLLTNLGQIGTATQVPDGVSIVSWLPQFHDMGLIGMMLFPIWVAGTVHFLSPAEFIQRPARWLQAMSRFRAFGSVAPHFGYAYAAERIREEELEGVDLSSVEVLMCGAEPVRADTLRQFQARFGRYGLRERVYFPCYGLAEATLFVSGGPGGLPLQVRALENDAGKVQDRGSPGDNQDTAVVSCGRLAEGVRVRIAERETATVLPPGSIGEVMIAGDNVTSGYWGRSETDRIVLSGEDGDFLPTGDLGFFDDEELYITGRLKDLIIVRGRNLYPQDVEALSERLTPGASVGSAGAVAVTEADGGARLVLVQEVRKRDLDAADAEPWRRRITAAVSEHHGVSKAKVLFVRSNTIPRTTSGKISRSRLKKLIDAGTVHEMFAGPAPSPALSEVSTCTIPAP